MISYLCGRLRANGSLCAFYVCALEFEHGRFCRRGDKGRLGELSRVCEDVARHKWHRRGFSKWLLPELMAVVLWGLVSRVRHKMVRLIRRTARGLLTIEEVLAVVSGLWWDQKVRSVSVSTSSSACNSNGGGIAMVWLRWP